MEIESTDQIFRSERDWGRGFDGGAAAALCPESGEMKKLPGRAGAAALKSLCSA